MKVWLAHCTHVSSINRSHWWTLQKFHLEALDTLLFYRFILSRIETRTSMSASTYWYTHTDEFTLKIPILGFRFTCSFNILDLNWNIFFNKPSNTTDPFYLGQPKKNKIFHPPKQLTSLHSAFIQYLKHRKPLFLRFPFVLVAEVQKLYFLNTLFCLHTRDTSDKAAEQFFNVN